MNIDIIQFLLLIIAITLASIPKGYLSTGIVAFLSINIVFEINDRYGMKSIKSKLVCTYVILLVVYKLYDILKYTVKT